MEFLVIICLLLAIPKRVAAAPDGLQTFKVEIRLIALYNIPMCKHENRRLDGENRCDFKLKLRDINSVEGKEDSIRVQNILDQPYGSSTTVIKAVRRIKTNEKLNMTMDIFDYDQANYHPDRLLGHFVVDLSGRFNQKIYFNTICPMKSEKPVCIEITPTPNLEDKVVDGGKWSSRLKMKLSVTNSIVEPEVCISGAKYCYPELDFPDGDIKRKKISDAKECFEFCAEAVGAVGGTYVDEIQMCYCKGALSFQGTELDRAHSFAFIDNTRTCNITASCDAMRIITSYTIYPGREYRCIDSDSQIDFGTTSIHEILMVMVFCDVVCWNRRTGETVWAVGGKTLLFKKPLQGETIGVFCVANSKIEVRDVNGDGKDDLVCIATNKSIFSNIDGLNNINPSRKFPCGTQINMCTSGAEFCYPGFNFPWYTIVTYLKVDNEKKCREHCATVAGAVGGSYITEKQSCRCQGALRRHGIEQSNATNFAFASNTRSCSITTLCSVMRIIRRYYIYPTREIRCNDHDSKLDFGDFNGDGICDAVCWNKRTRETIWAVGMSTLAFWKPDQGESAGLFCVDESEIEVRDVNGDGKDDLVCSSTNEYMLSGFNGLNSRLIDSSWTNFVSHQHCDLPNSTRTELKLNYKTESARSIPVTNA